MRHITSLVLLFAIFVASIALALALEPDDDSWSVFNEGPELYSELQQQGLMTSEGLLGPDGKPLGNFVIRTGLTSGVLSSEEGMFRTHAAVERYLGSDVLLPDVLPGWQSGVIRTAKDGVGDAYHASIEYRQPESQAHILASQSDSSRAFEIPSGRGVERQETHDVDGTQITLIWLRVTEGSRDIGYWNKDDGALTATVSTEESMPLPILLDFVARTLRR